MTQKYIKVRLNNEEVIITLDQFEYEFEGSDKRNMGVENCYRLYWKDDQLLYRFIYEYPLGCLNYLDKWEGLEVLEDTTTDNDYQFVVER